MKIWILNFAQPERDIFSTYLACRGHKVKTIDGHIIPKEGTIDPDVLLVGTAIDGQGLKCLEQMAQLERVADSYPGIPVIAVTSSRFSVPTESFAAGVIHSFVHRPVPLEELEMEINHLDC